MRISDWSSDVCSSDLRPSGDVGRRVAAIGLGRNIGHFGHRKGDDVHRQNAHHGEAAQRVEGDEAFARNFRSEEHTSELQSLMRISYAVFCLKQKTTEKQA